MLAGELAHERRDVGGRVLRLLLTARLLLLLRPSDLRTRGLLLLRLLLGVAVAAALLAVERTTGLSYWYEPLLVVGFIAFWWLLGYRDVRTALLLVRRPQAAADVPPPV